MLGVFNSVLTLYHYIRSSKSATLYPHEEDLCWWMWCSLCIDFFSHYAGEYFCQQSSVLFLTMFCYWTLLKSGIQVAENLT